MASKIKLFAEIAISRLIALPWTEEHSLFVDRLLLLIEASE